LQQGEGSISDNIDMSAKMERPLVIPVILGTARQGRQSENVARFVFEQTKKRADVETELIDVRALPMRLDDAGEQMKDPKFRSNNRALRRADSRGAGIQSWLARMVEARARHEFKGIHP